MKNVNKLRHIHLLVSVYMSFMYVCMYSMYVLWHRRAKPQLVVICIFPSVQSACINGPYVMYVLNVPCAVCCIFLYIFCLISCSVPKCLTMCKSLTVYGFPSLYRDLPSVSHPRSQSHAGVLFLACLLSEFCLCLCSAEPG